MSRKPAGGRVVGYIGRPRTDDEVFMARLVEEPEFRLDMAFKLFRHQHRDRTLEKVQELWGAMSAVEQQMWVDRMVDAARTNN